ncbi:TPA: hypothetical protein LAM16_003468 [Escherichia coli]|uniref:hypothetical protein n=1 Tax=Enterobacteriaceae TaxID=543 RepID=UPI001DE9CC7B|nr:MULTISPECIES: hypothetical protein [Enterobacteriaceae]MCJ6763594.1 hypothetical protein [Klebsiella variicola]MCY9914929.1 hypothetical protein [Escherichia coli]UND83591.1 hypothetical protein H9194_06895 [Escherichia coli]HBJ0167584.1 hypothetical protein [Escherichia coli]HBJ0181578.1 hypothetical protein [Escherichia coli]
MKNEDVEELIEKVNNDFDELSEKVENALSDDEIKKLPATHIKQIAENIRSALDYMAVDILAETGIIYKKKIYYPYGPTLQKLESFNPWMVELKVKNPKVYSAIVQWQDFSLRDVDRWIIQLCNLSIKVKHNKLERPQRVNKGKSTIIGGWMKIDDTSTVTMADYSFQDKENGPVKKIDSLKITPTTTMKYLREKFGEDSSHFKVSFQDVSFITSSGDDVMKVLYNSIKALEILYASIYENL